MKYGHMINGQLIIVKNRGEADKPIVYTEPPVVDEHHRAIFAFEDTEDEIIQRWEVIETADEPPEEITDTEALSILLGGDVE